MKTQHPFTAVFLALVFLLAGIFSVHAQAAAGPMSMVGTHEFLAEQQVQLDRAALKAALADEGLQERLAQMGVSPEQVEQRIDSLTAAELAQFQSQLDEAPAGAGALGVLAFLLVLFIVTDMLCATNVFNFVNCIN